MNIKFGKMPPIDIKKERKRCSRARGTVAEDGLESNTFTTYDHNVEFANIKAKVNITRTKDDAPPQVGVAKGAILAGVPLTVPTNTAAATVHAMKKRCDFKPSLSTMDCFNAGHEVVMSKIDKMETIQMTGELFEKYIKKCAPGKSMRLLEALNGHELTSEMDTKMVFAKQEVLLKEHGAQPRVVYQGTDMYNALTGPIVMELNDRMKEMFSLRNPKNTGNRIVYACGASGEELGDIMESSVGTPVESDAKNNDGSQSKEFRRKEAMFYMKLGAPAWFVREFARTLKIRVWTRYGIAAEVEGERWSGETTTTTGNSYVHMCLMQAALAKARVENSTSIHGGDDYLGFIEGAERFQSSVEETYTASGMTAEVVPQSGRHVATFYRKRYLRGSNGTRPVPQFGRVLSKMNLRPNRNTQICDRDYMSGKYYSAAYEHRFVPGIRDLLLTTATTLSQNPYFDVRTTKMAEMGGVEKITAIVTESKGHSVLEMSEFLDQVYGIGYDDLFDLYSKVASSCIDYCDEWCAVGKDGRARDKPKNYRFNAPKITGDTIEALVSRDV